MVFVLMPGPADFDHGRIMTLRRRLDNRSSPTSAGRAPYLTSSGDSGLEVRVVHLIRRRLGRPGRLSAGARLGSCRSPNLDDVLPTPVQICALVACSRLAATVGTVKSI